MKRKIVLAVTLCAILILSVSTLSWAAVITQTVEDVAADYISKFKNETFSGVSNWRLNNALPGTDFSVLQEKINGTKDINHASRTVQARSQSEIMRSQYDAVVSSFGENAWNTVSYNIVREAHNEGKLGYREKDSGEYISKTEYDALNEEYLKEVSGEEVVTLDLLMQKYPMQVYDWISNLPAEIVTIEDYTLYRVELFFDGERVPEKGFGYFQFFISDKKGYWDVHEGIVGGYYDPEVKPDI